MQRVHPRVAPVAVEVVLGKAGAAAGQLEQLAAGGQRDVRSQRPGFGHADGGGSYGFGRWRGGGGIQQAAGAVEDGFGGVQADRQAAELLNG
ncbi:hypothetical protein D9M73_234790 [compost metagenome]